MGQFPSLRSVFNSACLLGSTFWTRDYTSFARYRPMAETIKEDCSSLSVNRILGILTVDSTPACPMRKQKGVCVIKRQTCRHRKRSYGYQRGKAWGRDKLRVPGLPALLRHRGNCPGRGACLGSSVESSTRCSGLRRFPLMSLLLNMLSRLVITFLPRSKRLLISWL